MLNIYEDMGLKILRHMESLPSGAELKPRPDVNSLSAYSYPELANVLGAAAYLDSVVLAKLERFGYLAGEIKDRILTCPYCMAYNICFRDVCPECDSPVLDKLNIIHHFRCSYSGREDEFMTESGLVCPKCRTPLIHIGKDYERPAEAFACRACSWTGAEPATKGHCISCDKDVDPASAVVHDAKVYRITSEGLMALKNGHLDFVEKNDDELSGEGDISIHFGKIKNLLVLAGEFIKQADSFNFPVSVMNIMPDVITKSGTAATKELSEGLAKTLAEVIRPLLRKTDYVACSDGGALFCLLPGTDIRNAVGIAENIREQVASMRFTGAFHSTTLSVGAVQWRSGMDAVSLFSEAKNLRSKASEENGNKVRSNDV